MDTKFISIHPEITEEVAAISSTLCKILVFLSNYYNTEQSHLLGLEISSNILE